MKDQRAGRALFSDLLETVRLITVPKCAKCRERAHRLMMLEKLNELCDLLNVPYVLRGNDMDRAGYYISRMGKR